MTIGIGFLLQDVAFLIADGRTRTFDRPGQPIVRDDAEKILPIATLIGAVTFGFAEVSDTALRIVQSRLNPDPTPEEILESVKRALEASWQGFRMPPNIDTTDSHVAAGLLVGGYSSGTQFILSANQHFDGREFSAVSRKVGDALFLCAEKDVAGDVFDARVANNATPEDRQHGWSFDTIMRSAAETIRYMEASDPFIGGTIRYAVMCRGKPYDAGVYRSESANLTNACT